MHYSPVDGRKPCRPKPPIKPDRKDDGCKAIQKNEQRNVQVCVPVTVIDIDVAAGATVTGATAVADEVGPGRFEVSIDTANDLVDLTVNGKKVDLK
ncbi:MAG: hypothetical protein M0Q40_06630 [Limnochordia bacterium]|jgi:hypothetical protein|nr:hypothetical protein [Limnochordia bacterium]